jgi:hypothetical protein
MNGFGTHTADYGSSVREEDEEMARSELTPLGAVVRGLVAGAVGTAAMDLLQFARYKLGGGEERLLAWEFSAGLKDWEQAPAPAHIGKRVVEGVFQRQLPPERAALTNNLVHWGYGIAWGGLFGLVEGSVRSPKVHHGLALGATVWTASYIFLPLAKLYRPIWEYDVKVLAKDLGDQLVYGLGTAGAYRLLAGR